MICLFKISQRPNKKLYSFIFFTVTRTLISSNQFVEIRTHVTLLSGRALATNRVTSQVRPKLLSNSSQR